MTGNWQKFSEPFLMTFVDDIPNENFARKPFVLAFRENCQFFSHLPFELIRIHNERRQLCATFFVFFQRSACDNFFNNSGIILKSLKKLLQTFLSTFSFSSSRLHNFFHLASTRTEPRVVERWQIKFIIIRSFGLGFITTRAYQGEECRR